MRDIYLQFVETNGNLGSPAFSQRVTSRAWQYLLYGSTVGVTWGDAREQETWNSHRRCRSDRMFVGLRSDFRPYPNGNHDFRLRLCEYCP